MFDPYILKLKLSKNIKLAQLKKKTATLNVNYILDILGIIVFGYSIYMCTHEKQDLFSNGLDNAGFKHEPVMGIQRIFICLTV